MIGAIGTDILSLKRLKSLLNRFSGRLVKKILSEREVETYRAIGNERRQLEFLGGRFCAKEAIFKASQLPTMRLTWKRVSILSTSPNSGRPVVFIDSVEERNVSLSISHENDYVIATALWSNQ
jgi:holo-[acyl-carrier protein] synthase